MPSYLQTDDGLFYSKDGAPDKMLLSFWDFYKNLGALPIHVINPFTGHTLPNVLKELREKYGALAGEEKNAEEELSLLIAAAMVFDQSFLGYRPLRILSSGGGFITAMLALAAREAHPDSRVYALMDGEGDAFPDADILGEARGNIKAFAVPLDDGVLRSGWFDMAVLSGAFLARAAQDRAAVVRNMLRVTRKGGYLLCLSEGDEKLRSVFLDLPGAAPEVYEIAKGNDVLVKRIAARYKERSILRERMRLLHAKLKDIAGSAAIAPEQLRAAVGVLKEMEAISITLFDIADIDMKYRINEAKEHALNALYTEDDAFRHECAEKLRAFAAG